MKKFTPRELAIFARDNSPYYRNLYSQVATNFLWEDLPIVDQKEFWKANIWKSNKLLTCSKEKGLLFKSGGTTGKPKFSYFSDKEWHLFCEAFGKGMGEANLEDGDRVGNLFYAGELYASFLFIQKSLELCDKEIITFPFAGKTPFNELAQSIAEFEINVLCGVPTSFIQFAKFCLENKIDLPLRKILYGGEALYFDQEKILKQAFPGVQIYSVGYASVDGGMLGKRSADCVGAEHRVFQDETLMEIVDEDENVIIEEGVEGRLLLTNLTRTLMPIIRYPVGDQAKWVEFGAKLQVCGRSEEGARVGPITLNRDDLVTILKEAGVLEKISQFQMVTSHFGGRDALKILLVAQSPETDELNLEELEKCFYQQRTMFSKAIDEEIVHPVSFELCLESALFTNPRTGKCPVILDQRSI